jgi:predicted transcriptional regulator
VLSQCNSYALHRLVNGSDQDADGDAISLSLTTGASFASLTDNGDGSGSVSAAPGFSDAGSYPSSVTATTAGSSDSQTFSNNVNTVNRAVDLAPIADINTVEGTPASRAPSATDADGDAISLSLTTGASFATLTDNGDGTGSVDVNPGLSDAGSYPSSVTANSADATSDTENFTINVGEFDQAPVLDPIADINVDEGQVAATALNATDPDGDAISLSLATGASFATLTDNGNGTGSVTAAPGFSDAGDYPSSVTATAQTLSDTENFNIHVNNVDRAVVLAPIADINVDEGQVASTPVSASDADGDAISLSLTTGASFASLTDNGDGSGSVSASPGFSDAGSYPSSVTATTAGSSDSQNFSINVNNVNRAVDLAPIADINTVEGTPASRALSATDADGDAISLSLTTGASFATLTDNGNGTGSVDVNPGLSDAGSYPSSVTANSADATSDTENFTINVGEFDQAPVLDPIADINVDEGQVGSTALNAPDPDGDAITLSLATGASFATLTDNGNGTGAVSAAPGFSDEKCANRAGSRSKASRRSSSRPWASKWPRKALHASVRSQRSAGPVMARPRSIGRA